MVHPTNLLRSDSDGAQRFAAPVENYLHDIDCGIKMLPCLSERLHLQKLAKLSIFVALLSAMGFVTGIIAAYVTGTSELWTKHFDFPSFAKTWLIISNQIFKGLLALCIAYWGNRIHRATWIGASAMLLAISAATLIIPEIYHPFTDIEITSSIMGPTLCGDSKIQQSSNFSSIVTFNEVTFGYYIVFEIFFGIMAVSFITHGLTYVDDHTTAKHSPILIGTILAAYEIGKCGGIYCSWSPFILHINSVFISPIWLTSIIVTFLIGFFVVLFPKELPSIVLKKSVNDLVNIASGGNRSEQETVVDGFFRTVWSLLKNYILMLHVASFTLFQSAILNFGIFEKYFNQSKYHVSIEEDTSGFTDPSIIQFTTNLLKQPFVSISMITSGFFLVKLRPRPKYLVLCNIFAFILIILLFSSSAFLNCSHSIENEYKNSITIPYCSYHCGCPTEESFQPVCVDGKTYFSPCLAGCRNFTSATLVYHNCSCGSIVTEGSCDEENCKVLLALNQVNKIIINGIVATTLLVNIVFIMRIIPKQKKATALGLQLTFLGIVPYIPVKILYHIITERFCEIKSTKGCQYFSESFPLAVSLTTIGLMICAVLLSVVLFFLVKKLNVCGTIVTYDYGGTLFNENLSSENNDDQTPEEQSLFLNQLNETLARRCVSPISRQERIQSYLEEAELVPPLHSPKSKYTKHSTKGVSSDTPTTSSNNKATEIGEKPIPNKTDMLRPSSRTSNKRNSKASGESDMSSLYRFADSIENLEENSSQSFKLKASIGSSWDKSHEPKLSLTSGKITETEF